MRRSCRPILRIAPRRRWGAALAAAALAVACGGGQTVSSETAAEPDDDPTVFSAARAWGELESLVELGPRLAGSEAAAAARERIRFRLEGAGLSVDELETIASPDGTGPFVLRHLVATLPGASDDRFVLVAPYDSGRYEGIEFVGANEGASGAALLIEVARVLSTRELPYTVELAWLEGEGRLGRGAGGEPDLRWLGSRGLAERWRADGRLPGIRLLVSVDRVCDADLQIARDLGSQRTLREQFWRAARELGRTDAFARSRYESVDGSHRAFRSLGVRPVVALADTAFGGDEPPGAYARSEADALAHCDPASLATVGEVTLEALDAIGTRLVKIDRFARTPSVPAEAVAGPTASEAAPSGDEGPPDDAGLEDAAGAEEPDAGS